jgi:DNA modification methylase
VPIVPPSLAELAVPVASLRSYKTNPNRGDVAAIARSLQRNGQYRAIVVNRGGLTGRPNEILAGNHTWAAAVQLGEPDIAVTWVDVDDDACARIVLADNRLAQLASYDEDVLLELLEAQPDLDGTGWSKFDVDALISQLRPDEPVELVDRDHVPDMPTASPVSRPGQLWLLGAHRLVCGDATDPGVLLQLLDGDPVDCVWTDPPYGVSYVGKTEDALTIANDNLSALDTEVLLRTAFTLLVDVCKPGAAWYVTCPGGPALLPFGKVLTDLGIWRQTLIWVKDSLVLGRSDFHYRHEPMLYGWTPGATPADPPPDQYGWRHEELLYGWVPSGPHTAPPDRKQDTIWEVPRPTRSRQHPTMKPTELIARALRNSTAAEALVLDPFAGSGSTLVACHVERRRARLVELDPRYADVICTRWQELTGMEPIDGLTGRPVDFLAGA